MQIREKIIGGWIVELYQFTSDGTTVDLKIIFDGADYEYSEIVMEGIEFQPLEKVSIQIPVHSLWLTYMGFFFLNGR